ncbi:S8 family peptidase, partial [candidate division WOR-3 bacterium]|nr:S8 family peptidase [candidate division WOR-3 bacterium]
TSKGGGYTNVIHTSFTGPQIAGLAALVFSAYPHATPQQVWDNIIQGADTIDSDVGPILRMNSRKAVERVIIAVEEERPEPAAVSAPGIQSGVIRFVCELSGSYTLRLFDVTGSQVYLTQGKIERKGEIFCSPALGSGVYFWRFKTSEGTSSGKFIYVR